MFSVIVPTLWRSNRILKLLSDLNNAPKVSEIILINNCSEQQKIQQSDFSKLKILTTGANEFVNPSWNLGVQNSTQENIVLCNDDINFNTNIFEFIQLKEKEIIGCDKTCFSLLQDEEYSLNKASKREHGFGCLMFFKKQSYPTIPSELKVWYGDDFLFDSIEYKFVLSGLKIETEMSATSNSIEFKFLKTQDEDYFYKNIKKWY